MPKSCDPTSLLSGFCVVSLVLLCDFSFLESSVWGEFFILLAHGENNQLGIVEVFLKGYRHLKGSILRK